MPRRKLAIISRAISIRLFFFMTEKLLDAHLNSVLQCAPGSA
jgi:hypothetical protein